ncbi:hypothetical protein HYT24_00965 [Candidatus Pacearchaeota archaeon]|nr:hypothetical protein [Candidatus Pacearchaeota archaeon]
MGRVQIGESIESYEDAMTAHWNLYIMASVLFFGGIFFWWLMDFSISFNPGILLIIAGIIVFLIGKKIGKSRRRKYRF